MNDIDTYLAKVSAPERKALEALRKTIRTVAPDAVETMSSKVPAFTYHEKYLVSFSATPRHLALLVMQGYAMQAFKHKLSKFDTGSKIIRFTASDPLPFSLIEKIIRFRMNEIELSKKDHDTEIC